MKRRELVNVKDTYGVLMMYRANGDNRFCSHLISVIITLQCWIENLPLYLPARGSKSSTLGFMIFIEVLVVLMLVTIVISGGI